MKKSLIYVICGIVLVGALAAMLIFVLSGDNTGKGLTIEGEWNVVSYIDNGSVTLSKNEHMVFDSEIASVYRDGETTPYATSAYEIADTNILKLPDLSKEYTVDKKTENVLILATDQNMLMCLVKRNSNTSGEIHIEGKWTVALHALGTPAEAETIHFEAGNMALYQNNGDSPVVTSEFSLDGNSLSIPGIKKTMTVYSVDDNVIVLTEADTGYVWELRKAN